MMTLNTSVLIALALTLMRCCAEGCVETFPNLTDSSTECNNTTRTCSVTCKRGKIFYDGNYNKTYNCNEDNIWSPSVPMGGCKDKTQALYWIRLAAKYHSSYVAAYCIEAHEKTIGNLIQQFLSFCIKFALVGNISISNITSTSHSFKINTVLELKLVNSSMTSFKACITTLRIDPNRYMTYDSPITCNSGMTSNVTIEGDIVDSYITGCEDHYVLVKDSNDNNYCDLDDQTTVQYTPTFNSVLTDGITQPSTGDLTDSTTETSTSGLTYSTTETSTSGLTYSTTETSTGDLTDSSTETSTGGLKDSTTETSTGGLTDSITDTSNGGLTDDMTETKNDQTLFISIGAGCGGLIIAIVVLVILIKSCRSTSSASQRGSNNTKLEQDHQDSYDSDYGGLKDNSMYIPFDQHELIDQTYSTVDSQRSLSAENRLATDANDRRSSMDAYGKSHENTKNTAFNNEDDIQKSDHRVENVCPPTGSNDIYAQVDKGHEKKPSVDKIQPNIDEVRQQDQTYAVVNKTT